jgi:CP family cyanate transporter-like MFS transporter
MDRRQFWLALALLWVAGIGLRLTVLAVPPILPQIEADLGLTGTHVGILSGLPIFLFAAAAIPGALLIARFGALNAAIVGLLVAGIGGMLRGLSPDIAVLYLTTIVMGAGIAFMQPAMPALVRAWVPQKIGFATALYTNGLLVGEVVPVALTVPFVLPLVDGSWRASLVFWGAPMILFAALMLFAPRSGAGASATTPSRRWWPDWRDSLVWKLGFILSSVNSAYFNANAFIPSYLTSNGRADLVSSTLTALNFAQLPASALTLVIAQRLVGRRWPFVVTGVAMLIAIAGIALTASAWTIAFAALLGFAGAITLSIGFVLPAVLSAPEDVGRVSAAMFTVSYTTAMLFSVLGGVAWDIGGNPQWAFLPVLISLLPQIVLIGAIRFAAQRTA